MTLIEQLTDDIVLNKTRLDTAGDELSLAFWKGEIGGRKAQLRGAFKTLRICHASAWRYRSRAGTCSPASKALTEKTAVVILIRMLEMGNLSREQVAA